MYSTAITVVLKIIKESAYIQLGEAGQGQEFVNILWYI